MKQNPRKQGESALDDEPDVTMKRRWRAGGRRGPGLRRGRRGRARRPARRRPL